MGFQVGLDSIYPVSVGSLAAGAIHRFDIVGVELTHIVTGKTCKVGFLYEELGQFIDNLKELKTCIEQRRKLRGTGSSPN
jgi:hypothetical protein